jgi:hypothetical protein
MDSLELVLLDMLCVRVSWPLGFSLRVRAFCNGCNVFSVPSKNGKKELQQKCVVEMALLKLCFIATEQCLVMSSRQIENNMDILWFAFSEYFSRSVFFLLNLELYIVSRSFAILHLLAKNAKTS